MNRCPEFQKIFPEQGSMCVALALFTLLDSIFYLTYETQFIAVSTLGPPNPLPSCANRAWRVSVGRSRCLHFLMSLSGRSGWEVSFETLLTCGFHLSLNWLLNFWMGWCDEDLIIRVWRLLISAFHLVSICKRVKKDEKNKMSKTQVEDSLENTWLPVQTFRGHHC